MNFCLHFAVLFDQLAEFCVKPRPSGTPDFPPPAGRGALADPGGATEAMASPKRQTREAKLCFGLPQTGQWVYLVSTESTDFTGFVT